MGGNSMIYNLTQKKYIQYITHQQFIALKSMLCVNNFDKSCIKSGKFNLLSQNNVINKNENATSYKRFIYLSVTTGILTIQKKTRNLYTHTNRHLCVHMFL